MVFRPATPGFIVTLVATGLLAAVSFGVPYLKSVFFLRASLAVEGVNGSIIFGTLGYCLELSNGTTCSPPSVGYQLDANKLLGNTISFAQIPQVVVKWVTYGLFLHVIALIFAAIAAFLGLLAHVREFQMTCLSSSMAGIGASLALIAFIFDLILFFVVKARINKVPGGAAAFGNAIWLTVAAWVLLFFSGCFYGLGRCCIRSRPRFLKESAPDSWSRGRGDNYADQMRLDAVKAEVDRKARQKQTEHGLPAFPEQEYSKPLNSNQSVQYLEDEEEVDRPYRDQFQAPPGIPPPGPGRAMGPRNPNQTQFRGGYTQAPPGTSAVDDYYNAPKDSNSYPPRQYEPSVRSQSTGYAASSVVPSGPPPPVPVPNIAGAPQGFRNNYLSPTEPSGPTPFANPGHPLRGSSYHSAMSHQQYPSQTSDDYASRQQPSFSSDAYNSAPFGNIPSHSSPPPLIPSPYPTSSPYHSTGSYSPPQPEPQRNYTLGGGGYGSNTVPDTRDGGLSAAYVPQSTFPAPSGVSPYPPPIATNVFSTGPVSPKGPRPPTSPPIPFQPQHDDAPPRYDGPPEQPNPWPEKR